MPVPEGFDYDFWLGPAPEAPYHIERCFHRWRYILDYSNGQTANFGCHTNDIAQWALDMDGTTPVEFEDNGSEFLPGGSLFTTATKTAFRARYANGIEADLRDAQRLGDQVRGHRRPAGDHAGRQPEDVSREPQGLGDRTERDPPAARAIPARERTSASTSTRITSATSSTPSRAGRIRSSRWRSAISTASLCILGNIAQILKRKFTWDPVAERSTDEDVNRMLRRPMREPWKLAVG